MLFRKKKQQETGIFDDLPVIPGHPSTQRVEHKKRGHAETHEWNVLEDQLHASPEPLHVLNKVPECNGITIC